MTPDTSQNPQPVSGNEVPRAGGPGTFMRLPATTSGDDSDIVVLGAPFDSGASNRPGARFGPRAIRNESALLRPANLATSESPFDSLKVRDGGDISVIPYSVERSLEAIADATHAISSGGARPLILGGDHSLTLGALRGIKRAFRAPLGLFQLDAHADTNDQMSGEELAHGTPFRRAVEEGVIDPERTIQVGLRGSGYGQDDWDWGRREGFRVLPMHECESMSPRDIATEVCRTLGSGPWYLTLDIDAADPSVAPGTGTPEIGGFSSNKIQEMLRAINGLDLVGADVVEVSPPYDPSAITALLGANLAFEILCIWSRA